MNNEYIREHMTDLLEDIYNDDLERLKAVYYGLDYILNGMEYNLENDNDIYNFNELTTCILKIKKIIDEQDISKI